MTMIYSNPARENEDGALPGVEVFRIYEHGRRADGSPFVLPHRPGEQAFGLIEGWYWWTLDDTELVSGAEPVGPFDTEAEAIADAQSSSSGIAPCGAVHVAEDDNPNCNPDDSGNEECSLRAVVLPPCVLAMRRYCAGHTRGNPASEPCDTNESTPLIDPDTLDGAPGAATALAWLEQVIRDVCDEDTQNEISDRYRVLAGEIDDDSDGAYDGTNEHAEVKL